MFPFFPMEDLISKERKKERKGGEWNLMFPTMFPHLHLFNIKILFPHKCFIFKHPESKQQSKPVSLCSTLKHWSIKSRLDVSNYLWNVNIYPYVVPKVIYFTKFDMAVSNLFVQD